MIVDLSSFFAHLVWKRSNLLLILLTLVVDDVVEAELVDTLGGGDDAQPVTELLLLKVLLGPVEKWSARNPRIQVLIRGSLTGT